MINLAILGTGMIAGEALQALQSVPEVKVRTVFARPQSRTKAEALAARYGIGSVDTDYDQLLHRDDIDFVYIGLVNSVHYEYARKALEADKNVILEKPSCPTAGETRRLAQLARQRGLYLFEAVTFLHAPFFNQIAEALPLLGLIKLILCNYSKYSSRYDRYLKGDVAPVFDPAQNGGAFLDLNIYNINFLVGLFGKPDHVFYAPNRGFNGVDTSGVALCMYPTKTASCTAAKDSVSPSFISVQGEKGWLRVEGTPDDFKYWQLCCNGKVSKFSLERTEHRMTDEFRDFNRIYTGHRYAAMEHFLDISVAVSEVADEALASMKARK
jgi:predicted dehydrogenase